MYIQQMTNASTCDSTVATAAPYTPACSTNIKNKSPAMFNPTDTASMISGVTVSPSARSAAAHASYKNVASIPATIITIYDRAVVYNTSGTFKNCRICFKNSSPAAVSRIEMPVPIISDAANDFLTPAISFAPYRCAVIMAKPLASPSKNPIIRLLSVLVAPTAASASSPKKDPTIRVSTRLYVSCNRLAKNIGIAKDRISCDGFPFVKSFMYYLSRCFLLI